MRDGLSIYLAFHTPSNRDVPTDVRDTYIPTYGPRVPTAIYLAFHTPSSRDVPTDVRDLAFHTAGCREVGRYTTRYIHTR